MPDLSTLRAHLSAPKVAAVWRRRRVSTCADKEPDGILLPSAKAGERRRSRQAAATSVAVLLMALLPVSSLVLAPLPCRAQAAGDVPAAVITPDQRAAALAGAQGVVGKLGQVRSFTGFADVLTNRSAGALGLFLTAIAGMAVSFGDMPGAKTTSGISPAQMKADYDALLARYDLSEDKMASDKTTLPPAVLQHGRQFLVDIGTFLDKTGSKSDTSFHGNEAPQVNDLTYTVLSPTQVHMTMKPKPGRKVQPPFDAVLEDGQWRLDLGDIKKMFTSTAGPPDDTTLNGTQTTGTHGDVVLATNTSSLAVAFFQAVENGKTSVVKTMLRQHPGLAKAIDAQDETALFQSVFFEDVPTIRALIAAGADVNAHDDSGRTPLDDAILFHKDDPSFLAMLRKYGAKPGSGQH
jgi:hypothetical protein